MRHRFRIVFARCWSDDREYVEEIMAQDKRPQAAAIIAQLKAEIDQDERFANRFRFSTEVTLPADDVYYCLGEIEYEGPDDEEAAFDQFVAEFQQVYDKHGVAGHFGIVPSDTQPKLQARVQDDDWSQDAIPRAPAWVEEQPC